MTIQEVFESACVAPDSKYASDVFVLKTLLSTAFSKWVHSSARGEQFNFEIVEDIKKPRGVSVKVSYSDKHPLFIEKWVMANQWGDYDSPLCPTLWLRLGRAHRPKQEDGKRPQLGFVADADFPSPEDLIEYADRVLAAHRTAYLEELEHYEKHLDSIGLSTAELRQILRESLKIGAFTALRFPFEVYRLDKIHNGIFDAAALKGIRESALSDVGNGTSDNKRL